MSFFSNSLSPLQVHTKLSARGCHTNFTFQLFYSTWTYSALKGPMPFKSTSPAPRAINLGIKGEKKDFSQFNYLILEKNLRFSLATTI